MTDTIVYVAYLKKPDHIAGNFLGACMAASLYRANLEDHPLYWEWDVKAEVHDLAEIRQQCMEKFTPLEILALNL